MPDTSPPPSIDIEKDFPSVLKDPVKFQQLFWPGSVLTQYQVEILESIQKNKITVCVAGNKLGKDYVSGLAAVWFFASRVPARVITSSVDGSQLQGVLWGEIRNFIQTSKIPLPFQVNHMHLRQVLPDGTLHGASECIGRVVQQGEGLLGRHLPYGEDMEPSVLAIIDEASGFSDENFMGVDTWAHRILIIGNAFPCENFFKRYVNGGSIKSDSPFLDHDVKVIKIPAIESPNIQLALAEEKAGKPMSRRILVPGCMDYDDYKFRCKTYDPVKKAAGIDAEFYEGEEVRMYPQPWLANSAEQARKLETLERSHLRRVMGVDPAEGGDNTVWTVVDRLGIIDQIAIRTSNTALIKGRTIALIKQYGIDPNDVIFDRGGGGREHADYLRSAGWDVRSVGFGEAPTLPDVDEFTPGWIDPEEKKDIKERKYAYKNRRAQMYGLLREAINPDKAAGTGEVVFGIPAKYEEIYRQLTPLPLQYDGEGRMFLPPKDKPGGAHARGNKGLVTIKSLLGCSPDETDSLVLAVFALIHTPTTLEIGAIK